MSYKPYGQDGWPGYVIVGDAALDLAWVRHERPLHGFYAAQVPEDGNWEHPAYACPVCKDALLVPFPEVEKRKELEYWLGAHLAEHDGLMPKG